MGLSIRAYARHRGVSHVAVKKAIDTGRITPLPDGTIDPVAADMAFIQLSLLGIAAEVVTGNTLTMQIRRVRYTPVFYLNDFEKRLADLRRFRSLRDFMRGIQEAA